MKFSEFVGHHEFPLDCGAEVVFDECTQLVESLLSGTISKTAAVAILLKISQLKQRILQDKNAALKELASMIMCLAGLVAVGIGTVSNDSELVSRAGSAGSR